MALALAAPSLRLQAPVPGEPVVGVEVPNRSSTLVTMRSVMETPEYKAMLAEDGLPVTLGLASAGEPVAVDLLKMPHLLIAGATGSGKSVWHEQHHLLADCAPDPGKGCRAAGGPETGRADAVQRDSAPGDAGRNRSGQGGPSVARRHRGDEQALQAAGGRRRPQHPVIQPLAQGDGAFALLRHLHRRVGGPDDDGVVRGEQAICRLRSWAGPRDTHDRGDATAVGRRGNRAHQGELPKPDRVRGRLAGRLPHDHRRGRG